MHKNVAFIEVAVAQAVEMHRPDGNKELTPDLKVSLDSEWSS
jgi:hypothetical protein